MNRLLPHLMLYAALLAAPAARAQGYVGLGLDYSMTTAPLINFANMAVMNNNSMNTGLHSRGKAARMEAPPAVQRNARELAKVFPASSQAAMAQAFQQSMDVYQQVAAKMGWQRDDLDGAMAAFIVGNYMVFANREVLDEEFAAVAEQLRQGGGTRRLAEKQSAETIRNLYEKSAMVGAFMALAYKSQQQKAQSEHAAANLRNSARENLKLVLGADPERLQIDERGVMLVK
ncbi:DUF6683 family protein [Pseudoduganella sp. R-32]|uniref:DUF6683 family protein n=1 Tax=Pseudoduganella sp. R-32 TaxID=3404061 RepID=UPI003CF84FDF